jgi:hypothetical protein
MARLKEEKKANLKREKKRSHKITLNTSIMISRGIMPGIITRNRNKTEELKRKPKSQTRNGNLNKKNIPEENGTKSEEISKKKLFSE